MSKIGKSGIANRIESDLDALRERAQFRTLENPSGMNLCSNDYLNLARDPRLKQALLDAVAACESVGSTGSRLLSGNSREWEAIEDEFADFAGTEAALCFGSGYAANIGLISAIAGRGDLIFSDALNHASLIDGIRLSSAERIIYPHADISFVEAALREHRGHSGVKLIVSESVFSMDGDIAPIERLVELAQSYGAAVLVDEAHATGVHGPNGRGICAALGLQERVLATVHTCGKALASAGAFVCGSAKLREFLINRSRTFIFSTAMPPYLASQIRAALRLALAADDRREQLRVTSKELRRGLAAVDVNCSASMTQIIPICLGSNEEALSVAAHLQRAGFGVRAIRPPTVPIGTSRIRFSLTAAASLDDVRRLATATAAAIKGAQVLSNPVHA
ncbi:MAG TPA: 8-amino-7-oxononanoate synthase [Candidatus Aquilonibacter sp.]|nr:8-amino-7-oxononanoate synthase [Candidatus Aquilonibacter sp.]